MNELRLDLGTLEVERLDVSVAGLNGGLESFGMGHASTELGQSCDFCDDQASCEEGACACDGATANGEE